MFDTIQKTTQLTTDWAVLLVQLITHGVIDNSNNSWVLRNFENHDFSSSILRLPCSLPSQPQKLNVDENFTNIYENEIKVSGMEILWWFRL